MAGLFMLYTQAVHAAGREVAKLLACVLDAGGSLGTPGVVSGLHKALDDLGGMDAPAVEGHTLDSLHAGKGHDAGHDGVFDAVAQALLAKTVEVVVREEELAHEVVGALLLLVETLEVGVLGRRLDMTLDSTPLRWKWRRRRSHADAR